MNLNHLTASYLKDIISLSKKYHIDYVSVSILYQDDAWTCDIERTKNSAQLIFYDKNGYYDTLILGKDVKDTLEKFKVSKFYKSKIIVGDDK